MPAYVIRRIYKDKDNPLIYQIIRQHLSTTENHTSPTFKLSTNLVLSTIIQQPPTTISTSTITMLGYTKITLAALFLASSAAPILDKRSCGGPVPIPDCLPGFSVISHNTASFDALTPNAAAGNTSGLIFQNFTVASPRADQSWPSLIPSSGSDYVFAKNVDQASTGSQLPQFKPDPNNFQLMKLKAFNFGCSLPSAYTDAEVPWPCVLTVTAMTTNAAGPDTVAGSATFTYSPAWMATHANLSSVNFASLFPSLAVKSYFTMNVTDVAGNGNKNPSLWLDDVAVVVYGSHY